MPDYLIVGRKIIANYGAMYPTIRAEIARIENGFAYFNNYDGDEMSVRVENIKRAGERSVNGSPIGVFYENA